MRTRVIWVVAPRTGHYVGFVVLLFILYFYGSKNVSVSVRRLRCPLINRYVYYRCKKTVIWLYFSAWKTQSFKKLLFEPRHKKPVFGVCDQVRLKTGLFSYRDQVEAWHFGLTRLDTVLSRQLITIIITLFQEDNIFGTNASLAYGSQIQRHTCV